MKNIILLLSLSLFCHLADADEFPNIELPKVGLSKSETTKVAESKKSDVVMKSDEGVTTSEISTINASTPFTIPDDIKKILADKDNNEDIAHQSAQELEKDLLDQKKAQEEQKKAIEMQKQMQAEKEEEEGRELMNEILARTPYTYLQSPSILQRTKYNGKNKHLPPLYSKDRYSFFIFDAIRQNDLGAVRLLLLQNININIVHPKTGYTPLLYAAKEQRNVIFAHLLMRGADLNVRDKNGNDLLKIIEISHNYEAKQMIENINPR